MNDDRVQARKAAALFAGNDVLLSKTVLVETEWVLRFGYEIGRGEIHAALLAVLGMPRVNGEEPRQLAQALAWFRQGMDFADALHLASAVGAERFVTFDRKLVARSRELGGVPVEAA
ncbi:MAG: type II toxin-antitoxin system VapC family toxin [Burkholderiaceae bacterium]|nr:type II toxin-antitoxin system VapC family toxin [Burkholderiaceae bacterium]